MAGTVAVIDGREMSSGRSVLAVGKPCLLFLLSFFFLSGLPGFHSALQLELSTHINGKKHRVLRSTGGIVISPHRASRFLPAKPGPCDSKVDRVMPVRHCAECGYSRDVLVVLTVL